MAVATRNHVHLDTALGGAPENAPTATYKVIWPDGWRYQPFIIAAVDRAISGKLCVSQLTSGGNPVIFKNWDLILKTTRTEMETVVGLQGKAVYFVPNVHPDTSEDHTAYVRSMILTRAEPLEPVDVKLNYVYVKIHLEDNDTVT